MYAFFFLISIFSLCFSLACARKKIHMIHRYTYPRHSSAPEMAASGRRPLPFKTGAGIQSAGGRKNNHARTCIRTTTSSVLFATFSPPSHFTLLNIVYTTRNTCNILHKEFSVSIQLLSCEKRTTLLQSTPLPVRYQAQQIPRQAGTRPASAGLPSLPCLTNP